MEQELTQRLNAIEERLKTIETALKIKPIAEIPAAKPASQPVPAKEAKPSKSGAWLATVGVFFFILAASFFVKLAIDSGWLTPTRQLCGAVLFGVALITAGWRLRSLDKAYAGFLPAAGIVVLFMSAYAGHLHWRLYGELTAISLVSAASLFALYLFRKFDHEFFLISSTAGSFLIPFFINFSNRDLYSICIYFLMWDILYCVCAIILGQRLLIALTAYFAFLTWHFVASSSASGFPWQYSVLFQSLQFILLASATALFSIKRSQKLTPSEAWSFLPVLLIFYTIQYSVLAEKLPNTAPWISLGFAALLFAIYRWAENRLGERHLNSEPVVVTFIAITIYHSFYLELLPKELCPWFGLALIAALASQLKNYFSYERFWPAYWLIYAVIFSEYLRAFSPAMQDNFLINILFFAALFAGYWQKQGAINHRGLILLFSISQLLAGLEKLTSGSNYLTSSSWALTGFVMLLLAKKWRDVFLAKGALFVLAVVAAKVVLSDITSSNSIARIIALVVIGALMYGAGLIWRKISEWET